MDRRTKTWMVVAVLFTIINFASAIYAAVVLEPMHSGGHVLLALTGLYWVRGIRRRNAAPALSAVNASDDRIDQLQQSVDAVALEVERIGEAQRFNEKFRAEKVESRF